MMKQTPLSFYITRDAISILVIHPCSKVIGIFFGMSNDGIYFQCIDLKFFVLRDEVFCFYCGKYHECVLQRHACVNIQS